MPSHNEDLSCHATHIRKVYSTQEKRVENGQAMDRLLVSWDFTTKAAQETPLPCAWQNEASSPSKLFKLVCNLHRYSVHPKQSTVQAGKPSDRWAVSSSINETYQGLMFLGDEKTSAMLNVSGFNTEPAVSELRTKF